jgi:hypothetical protein
MKNLHARIEAEHTRRLTLRGGLDQLNHLAGHMGNMLTNKKSSDKKK